MDKRQFGNADLTVSVIGLGCNNFGLGLDAAASATVVDAALDAGIDFFDTADMYGKGQSEGYLGQALGTRRTSAVILTKFGMNHTGKREDVISAAEDSLRRLGTDYIDIFMQHRPDPTTPVGETLAALNALIDQGKVRHIACSNYSAAQLREADAAANAAGLRPFSTTEENYSILVRDVEDETIPTCRALGVGLLPYFPLASGLLTGKYGRKAQPADGRLVAWGGNFAATLNDENFDRIERLTAWAQARDHSLLDLAFAWLLAEPLVPSVIAGATRPEQVAGNAAAGAWSLTLAERDEVRALAL